MTQAQLLLANHACEYNMKRGDEYYEWKKAKDDKTAVKEQENPFVASVGKRLDEMNSDEIMAMNRRATARMFSAKP